MPLASVLLTCCVAHLLYCSPAVLLTSPPQLGLLGAFQDNLCWQPIESPELRTFNYAGQACNTHRPSLPAPCSITTIQFSSAGIGEDSTSKNPYCQYNDQALEWFTSSLFIAGAAAALPGAWVTRHYGRWAQALSAAPLTRRHCRASALLRVLSCLLPQQTAPACLS